MADSETMPPPPPKDDGPGLFEDLVDIIASPAKVFERRAKTGSAAAFFFVTIAFAAILYSGKSVMEPIMDAQLAKSQAAAVAANPSITPEQQASMLAVGRKFAVVAMIVGVPIALLFLGLFIWIVGKALGATLTYGAGLMIASFSYVPRILSGVITDVQGLLMSDTSALTNPAQLSIGPARFFDPVTTNAALLAILSRADVFLLWTTVLIGVGYIAAGKLSKEKAIAGAVILWVLGGLMPIWGAIRSG
ncbi:MAG: YIP1 family protein [Gemmatimonadetes bacterium]|nr:YIP1 family protein [Gemmatimonadota bacterium]